MKNYIYSAKNNAFFEISKRSLYDDADWDLSDAIEVDDDVFNEFTGTPPEGKERVAGDNGFPAWGDIPPLTHEQLVAAAETEKQSRIDQANDYMNGKQWPGKAAIGRLKGDELAQYNLWLDYLEELYAIETASTPDINWPAVPQI